MSSVENSDTDMIVAEQRARRFWVSLIVGLLGLQVAIGVAAISLATGDGSVAIIPNYYQSAVNWDTTRRARQLMGDLDWKLQRSVGPVQSKSQRREFRVQVSDASGQNVENLNIAARVFHHAHGDTIYQLKLDEIQPGIYATSTALCQSGLWQVDLQIEGDHGIAADSSELWVE
jgi:nitrogen fixation protein FixH